MMLLMGCQTIERNGVTELINHPQFDAARTNAPAWTKAALKKLAKAEYELERR
jgi:hypothetical protein